MASKETGPIKPSGSEGIKPNYTELQGTKRTDRRIRWVLMQRIPQYPAPRNRG